MTMNGFRSELERSRTSLSAFFDTFFNEVKATKMTPFGVSVGTASTVVLPGNAARRYVLLVNDSDTKMYVAIGTTAVSAKGVPVAPNGVFEMSYLNLVSGTINAISAGDAKNCAGWEGE